MGKIKRGKKKKKTRKPKTKRPKRKKTQKPKRKKTQKPKAKKYKRKKSKMPKHEFSSPKININFYRSLTNQRHISSSDKKGGHLRRPYAPKGDLAFNSSSGHQEEVHLTEPPKTKVNETGVKKKKVMEKSSNPDKPKSKKPKRMKRSNLDRPKSKKAKHKNSSKSKRPKAKKRKRKKLKKPKSGSPNSKRKINVNF